MSFRDRLYRHRGAVIWSIVGLSIVGWFGRKWLNTTTVKGEPPVASITFEDGVATIELSPGATIDDAMSMAVFLGADPSMDPEELVEKFGEEADHQEYWFKGSVLRFRSEDYKNSDEDYETYCRLSVFPPPMHLKDLFCEQISKLLLERPVVTRVRFKGPLRDRDGSVLLDNFEVVLDRTRVQEVIWHQ